MERANARLAEFQRVTRWLVWREPDLPRTSTGKVKRKAVAEWALEQQGLAPKTVSDATPSGDWLWKLVAEISGEKPASRGDDLRLSEDFHLDSLGRVQLAAALEERLPDAPGEGAVDVARTLGDLRRLVGAGGAQGALADGGKAGLSVGHFGVMDMPTGTTSPLAGLRVDQGGLPKDLRNGGSLDANSAAVVAVETSQVERDRSEHVFPRWPWFGVVQAVRVAFLELIAQPLVWFLAKPRVEPSSDLSGLAKGSEPMLIVCNHVTAYDGPLVQYALPGRMRRRVAAAMSGEMLQDFRHFRNPDHRSGEKRFMLFGPIAYLLLTALYNVFPLPRKRDFQRSFAHVGEALDSGYNVLVFPEGTRSAAGELTPFRAGIGLLVKQSQTAVLPMAISGLGELKIRGRGWFRSGKIEVRVGSPLVFRPEESEAEITAGLHARVEALMNSPAIQNRST